MTDEKIESIQMKAAIDEEKMDSDASKIDVVEEKFIKKEKVECSITKKEEEMTDDEESTNDGSEKVEKLNASVKDNKNDKKSIISEKDVENGDKSSEVNDSEIENGEKSSISDKDGEKMSEILDSESQAESEEEKEKKVFKLSVKKTEDLVTSTSSGFPNSASFNCSTCLIPFSSEKELEMHKSQMAHYICTASQKCMSIGYSSEAALAAHKAEMHSAQTQQSLPVQQIVHPVQQMVQQVERLPYPPQLSQVQISPVRQPQIPNLPGVQVTKRPISNPEPQSQPQPKVPRTSVTNLRLPQSITLTKPSPKKDVTNMLATRGITVVPSQGTSQSVPQRRVPTQLNSSVSITPSRQTLPTVDLTKDEPVRRRPHQPPTRRVCQICDKVFPSQDSLNSHLLTHRTPKQSFRCNICTAIYRSQVELDNHKMKFHPRRAQTQPVDLALPVVDVAQADVRQKLLQIGVRHVLRLSQLNNRSGTASFGLPIIPVDHANNPAFCSIGDMGASNLLPLGQLESL